MAKYNIMKAVEYDKLPAAFKKAHPFDGLLAEGYWLQKKYDGCFGIATPTRMLSRTLEDYTESCREILRHMPVGYVTLGEVWRPASEALFPQISGEFRRQRLCPELRFVVNDCLTDDEWAKGSSTRTYSERYKDFSRLFWHSTDSKVFIAQTCTSGAMNAEGPLQAAIRWKKEGGFDGAILRNPNAGYTVGTVKNGEIIKVKPVMSLDLRVVMVNRAVGEKTGRDVWTLDVVHNGVITTVGSGVPHDIRDINGGDGIAEIEFMGLTEDGRLREPRFKGMRHDKEQPDT